MPRPPTDSTWTEVAGWQALATTNFSSVFLSPDRSFVRKISWLVYNPAEGFPIPEEWSLRHGFCRRELHIYRHIITPDAFLRTKTPKFLRAGRGRHPERGRYYWLDLEYLPGRSLGEELQHITASQADARDLISDHLPCLSPAVASDYLRQIVAIVERFHQYGVVMVDLGLRNIHLLPSGEVKLLDFADAYVRGMQAGRPAQAYTVGFSAPEIEVKWSPLPADDVFSLAALLYSMATGTLNPGLDKVCDRFLANQDFEECLDLLSSCEQCERHQHVVKYLWREWRPYVKVVSQALTCRKERYASVGEFMRDFEATEAELAPSKAHIPPREGKRQGTDGQSLYNLPPEQSHD